MNLLSRTAQMWTSALHQRGIPKTAEVSPRRQDGGLNTSVSDSASSEDSEEITHSGKFSQEEIIQDEIIREQTTTKLNDEEVAWIARARRGEVVAFEWLTTRYRTRAVRLAAHVLRRPAEAEDVVQEAFLRAFVQIRSFRGDAAFYTWLARIVIRLCLNHMRHPGWRRESEISYEIDYGESTQQQTTDQVDTRLLIDTLMDQLSPPLRVALVLREVEGLDYQEIADTLQIPVGTVRSRLNSARAQFRTLWQSVLEETPHA